MRLVSKAGFSLLEVITSLALVALVFHTVSAPLVVVNERLRRVDEDHQLEDAYFQALLRVKNTQRVREMLNLTRGSPLEACFAKIGTNCTSFAGTARTVDMNALGLASHFGGGTTCANASRNCPYALSVSYEFQCGSSRSCEGVEFRVATGRASGDEVSERDLASLTGGVRNTRERTYFVEGLGLVSRGNVDLSLCSGPSAKRLIVGVDYQRMSFICKDGSEMVSCDGFSVLGLGPGSCGRAPSASSTGSCSMSFSQREFYVERDGSFTGAQLNWQVPSVGERFEYACFRRGQRAPFISNILYHFDSLPHEGRIPVLGPTELPPVDIECVGEIKDALRRRLGTCSAAFRYDFRAPVVAAAGASPASPTVGGGESGSSTPSSASSSSHSGATASGTGASLQTSVEH